MRQRRHGKSTTIKNIWKLLTYLFSKYKVIYSIFLYLRLSQCRGTNLLRIFELSYPYRDRIGKKLRTSKEIIEVFTQHSGCVVYIFFSFVSMFYCTKWTGCSPTVNWMKKNRGLDYIGHYQWADSLYKTALWKGGSDVIWA